MKAYLMLTRLLVITSSALSLIVITTTILGTYQFGEDFFIPHSRMNIVEQSGHLFVKDVFTQRLVGLLHTSELEFIQRSSWGRIKFQMDKAGKISGMLFSGKFKAEKLTTN